MQSNLVNQEERIRMESQAAPGQRRIVTVVKGELEKDNSTQWLEHKSGSQELPGVFFHFHSLILCILVFGFPFSDAL